MPKIPLALVILLLLALGAGCASTHVALRAEDLSAYRSGERLLVVLANASDATLYAFQRPVEGGQWEELLWANGFVGSGGISHAKREGDGTTPAGRYSMRSGFSFKALPEASIPCAVIGASDVWVDDPGSRYYNQWADAGQPERDWKSAEQLIRYPTAYQYGIVIEYNTEPIIKGAGSAVFLHCSTGRPTAGCVSVPAHVMLRLLRFVHPDDAIVIAGSAAELQTYAPPAESL